MTLTTPTTATPTTLAPPVLTQAAERVFAANPQPAALNRDLPSGLLMLCDPETARAGEVGRGGRRHWHGLGGCRGHLLVHAGDSGIATELASGLDAALEREVTAIAVHAGGPGGATWLPLQFALHLAEHRSHRMGTDAWLACAERPQVLPADAIAVPHLVAVTTAGGGVADRLVWEVMPLARVRKWLEGHDLPDQGWFEQRLPALVDLRRRLRDHQLPGQLPGPCAELVRLLHGRYLSIKFAYQHPVLISGVLDALQPASERTR